MLLLEIPSPNTLGSLPQENHTFIRKQNPFVYFMLFAVKKQTGLPCFAVVKFVFHGSLASCPGSSPKKCSLWKIPSPDTLGALPQENHTFIRKQNPFVYFMLFAVKKQTGLPCFGLLNSWFIVLSPAARALHQRNASFRNSFSEHSWHAASRKPHIYQKTKPFRVFRG